MATTTAPVGHGPPVDYNIPNRQPEASWMDRPSGPAGCPPGLEYLTQVDQLLVRQEVELLEVMTGYETNNRYAILNSMGQQIYYAKEDTSCFQRNCCGPSRGFTINITDNAGQPVMRISRDFKCCAGCSWCACSSCCYLEVIVEAPVGTVVGYARQSQSCCLPKYKILDAEFDELAHIVGPFCVCGCSDVNFPVMSSKTNDEIGQVTKQWSGLARELFTTADHFSISFPQDMDVRMKAIYLGALFLIDFMYFENKDNNNQHHH